MIESLKKLRQYLLTGVSFAIPFIACGGIMIACGIAFVPMTPTGPDFSHAPVMKFILDVGVASFNFLLPVLAGYIAYAMAGKPGLAGFSMGMIGITEGAIPFAASDPLRVIPCIMAGSMVASVVAMLGGVGDHAPHGGPIVLPVVDHRLMYVVAILAGMIVTALAVNMVKVMTGKNSLQPAGK